MRSFFFGASLLTGFAAAGVHRTWTKWEEPFFHDHQEGNNPKTDQLGGTSRTCYNFLGTTKEKSIVRPALSGNLAYANSSSSDFDAVVIGGGFAGLHMALSLAERGKKVVILEGKRVGSGASGRNGGSGLTGFHVGIDDIALQLDSEEKAMQLFAQAHAGYKRLKHLIAKYKIQCDAEEVGGITLNFTNDKDLDNLSEAKIAKLIVAYNKNFEQNVEFKRSADLEKMGAHVTTAGDRYQHGTFTPYNIQLNPLELCLGLARACESNGVQIFENSKVLDIRRDVRGNFIASTPTGAVRAKHCILCTNHAPWGLSKTLALRATAVSTAMMLTAPIDKEKLDKCIASHKVPAMFDTRYGLSYFRRVPGDRIMYGCFASGLPWFHEPGGRDEEKLKAELCKDLQKTFNKVLTLDDIRADRVWSGRLACQYPTIPLVGKDSSSGMYHSLAHAGHGIVPTCAASITLSKAICDGDSHGLELWDEIVPKWARLQGGPSGALGATVVCVMLRYYDQMRGRY